MKNVLIILSALLVLSCKTTAIDPMNEEIHNQSIPLSESYFKAQGNEPFWSLEISANAIQFKGIEKENYFNTPHVEPILAMDTKVKLYNATTEKGSLYITIAQTECLDSMSGINYKYSVTVQITLGNQKVVTIYNGCGAYSIDYRLHDVWVVEELEGKKMLTEHFLGELPMLEINSKMAHFSGFGGCNRIRGSLFQERETLRFTNVLSSKMACDPKNKEDLFLKALQSSIAYKIENNRLYLSNPDGMQLVFKKID
jgi:heat shock protein HslJ